MREHLRVGLAALLLVACGDDAVSPGDAMTELDSGPVGMVELEAPIIPWLAEGAPPIDPPDLLPCPTGWREVTSESSVTTCEPWPVGGPAICPDHEAHFPGEPGCTAIGDECPVGDFSESVPVDRIPIYVLARSAMGDGTMGSPYSTIAEALPWAGPGTAIVIGKGTYDEFVRVPRGVMLLGACVQETFIQTAVPETAAGVLTIGAAGAEIRNLTLRDSERTGIWMAGADAGAVLDGVLISGTLWDGMAIGPGAMLTGREVVIRGARWGGPLIFNRPGYAAWFHQGAEVELERAVFERNRAGFQVSNFGTSVVLRDAAIRSSEGGRRNLGWGVDVQAGGSATVESTLLEGTRDGAFVILGTGSSLQLTDAVVRETLPDFDGGQGVGGDVSIGATGLLSRVLIEDNHAAGLGSFGAGSETTASDIVVRDTLPIPVSGNGGLGIFIGDGARSEVTRALVEGNRAAGVSAEPGSKTGAPAHIDLSHVHIRGTIARADGFGAGANVVQSTMTIANARLEDNEAFGVSTFASDLSVADTIIRATRSRMLDRTQGEGIVAINEGALSIERTVFEDNREVGVYLLNTTATLEDVVVRDTQSRACAEDTCRDEPAGTGIGVYTATLEANRFEVSGSPLCGVQVTSGTELRMTNGCFGGNAIAACIQVPDYDLDSLLDRIAYKDNEVDIETTMLPVPDVGGGA